MLKKIYEIRRSVLLYYNKISENICHNDLFYLDLYNIEENDWLELNEIQSIAEYCGKIIIVIDYISLLIHIIIPKCIKSIIVNQDQLISLTYQQIIEKNGYIFDDFQDRLKQCTNYIFSPNGNNILEILETLLKNPKCSVISFTGIVNNKGHFHALQYKTDKRENKILSTIMMI
jgi:hypothetical protein